MSSESRSKMPEDLSVLQPDSWTSPFWDAATRHELVAPQCANCGEFRLPPTPFCWNCSHQDVKWITLSGEGVVHTFTIARQAFLPSLADVVPYVIAVIALPESDDLRLISNVVAISPEDVTIGMSVVVDWDDVNETTTIPRFRPVAQN
jgi:uncharacterized OB-fold protein